jgi:hypothetical protein
MSEPGRAVCGPDSSWSGFAPQEVQPGPHPLDGAVDVVIAMPGWL